MEEKKAMQTENVKVKKLIDSFKVIIMQVLEQGDWNETHYNKNNIPGETVQEFGLRSVLCAMKGLQFHGTLVLQIEAHVLQVCQLLEFKISNICLSYALCKVCIYFLKFLIKFYFTYT